ncbi:unnamed protein product [Didymodactylos carnosus]|uniref:Uncharacterized protein n=1 Tax=Didymodactylos carnosus TaxID=1234261 RepID=A0A814KT56_9BILA|nr:unnamed protein product [Didymodactylos carnosus]CAF1220837.1 unnamed protein product [Didymodactylos carnosus]CAF3825503.1 unnamed protein product [Didymodactylos carnosus]CAF4028979.1 unnamed protein product [Didymodactylos carnosus]
MDKKYSYFIINIVLILFSVIPFITTFKCRLYGVDQSSLETTFTEIINSTSYDRIINLGRVSFSGTATSVKIDNQKYVSTYHTSNSLGVPHYFLLIIDIHTKSIKLNLTLNEKRDSGSFWQIAAPNSNEIVGIRESFHAGSSLEVAKINQTNGLMETIGTYPYGSYSLVMVYASKRRLYYNVIESTFYAVNIDTGKLDINIRIPNGYTIYAIDYDSVNDRLIALVYSSSITNGWILTQLTITAKNEIRFDPIGKTIIPFEKYLWTTTYTMNTNERLWITIWSIKDSNKNIFIVFNIDTGNIMEKWETNLNHFSNLVCFD